MNRSIISVSANANLREDVRLLASRLASNDNVRFRIGFVKKDNTERYMTIVPRNTFNRTLGITTTQWGKGMVAAKSAKGMVTVLEIYEENGKTAIRPRTINLCTVFSVKEIRV